MLKDAEKKTLNSAESRENDLKNDELASFKQRLAVSFVFLIPLMYISMGHMLGAPIPSFLTGVENAVSYGMAQFLLTLPIVYVNRAYYINGFKTLFKLAPNMDSLVAIGSAAAIVYGVYAIIKMGQGLGIQDLMLVQEYHMDLYFESAAMILTLITIGKFLEARSKSKTSNSIEKLMSLAPQTAILLKDGVEVEVSISSVKVGDILLVRPGGSIPVDGEISEGYGVIDESMITGESIPVEKGVADGVIAGTINISGSFKMRTLKVGEDTTLSQIIQLVEDANMSKAPIARLADKVSGVFVPVVIGISILSCIVWLLVGATFDFALSIAIAVLIISCPCALGLATPTAIMVGTGKAAENGILFKSAESLELMQKVDTIILDKTGTVTEGKISVTDTKGFDDKLLNYIYSLEKLSEHPIAKAVVKFAEDSDADLLETIDFKMLQGQGIAATIDGHLVAAGNKRLMDENGMEDVDGEYFTQGDLWAARGETPLYISVDDKVRGVLSLKDSIKVGSRDAVKQLKGLGLEVIMITGDNKNTANSIAAETEIDNVMAEVMPQDKESKVRELQESGKVVAMVGDGINDSPALARADIGIAIGAGTDIAIESADIVLIKSDLRDTVTAIELSKATLRNIKQNLFWAFIYNIIGIPLAAGVLYPVFGLKLNPMFAAAAMSLSSFFVVTNALRLRFFKSRNKEEG